MGVVKRQRLTGRGPRILWRDAGYGQTTALAGGPAPSRRQREGLVVSRSTQSDPGFGVVTCTRQPEMCNDGGAEFLAAPACLASLPRNHRAFAQGVRPGCGPTSKCLGKSLWLGPDLDYPRT